MNFYVGIPRCPLCPNITIHSVQQLARHLCIGHLMKNSSSILARIMVTSRVGLQVVVEVLRDVKKLNDKWDATDKLNEEFVKLNKEFEQKIQQLEPTNHTL